MRRISVSDAMICRLVCFTALAVGPLGMFTSLLYLDSSSASEIIAGFAGFVAGAIVFAAGLISIAMIAPAGSPDFSRR